MSESKLALLGGKPAGGARIPKYPLFAPSAIRQVVQILESGRTVGLGRTNPVIARAEKAISRYQDGRHTLVVNSGHAALMAALMGLEVGPGDEVITTPYTWGASIACILHVGAVPVFVDVDPVTGLMDPGKVEAAITRRTKGRFLDVIYDGLMHEAHNRPCHKAHYIDWALGAIDLQIRLFNKEIEEDRPQRPLYPIQKPI